MSKDLIEFASVPTAVHGTRSTSAGGLCFVALGETVCAVGATDHLGGSPAADLLDPLAEPARTRNQDVREDQCRQWDREGRGVYDDDNQCPDKTVSETHVYLTISCGRELGRPRVRCRVTALSA